MATKKMLVLVGSTAGRGPCDACGLVAELHEVEERFVFAPGFVRVRDLCLPCSLNRGGLAPLPHLALRAA